MPMPLTQLLRARFHQDKIYVFGLSWGSILGIKLVQQHPDLFAAYIGNGQMVNTTENDLPGLPVRAQDCQQTTVIAPPSKPCASNGPPPYTGDGMTIQICGLY